MGYMSKEPKIKPIVIVGAGGMGGDTQWLIERINEEDSWIHRRWNPARQHHRWLSDSWRNEIPRRI